MNAFSLYAARVEQGTAMNAHTPVEILTAVSDTQTTPVSGDMLAAFKADTLSSTQHDKDVQR